MYSVVMDITCMFCVNGIVPLALLGQLAVVSVSISIFLHQNVDYVAVDNWCVAFVHRMMMTHIIPGQLQLDLLIEQDQHSRLLQENPLTKMVLPVIAFTMTVLVTVAQRNRYNSIAL